MFNACRRGPASISRVFRTASSTIRIPSTRPSSLTLSSQSITKPAIEARWLHVSSQLSVGWDPNDSTGRGGGRGFGGRGGGGGGGGRGGGRGRNDVYSGEPADASEFQPSRANPDFPLLQKFDELLEHSLVHPNVISAIVKDMGHHTMTEVQQKTINQALQGMDMYGLPFHLLCPLLAQYSNPT
jgi:ATP-dependent RNA helicase MSS116